MKQERWGGSGISWTIYKNKSFAPRPRQKTMPVPHHPAFTGRMPFPPANQQRQNTEGISKKTYHSNLGTAAMPPFMAENGLTRCAMPSADESNQ